jgi:hypothetical protein
MITLDRSKCLNTVTKLDDHRTGNNKNNISRGKVNMYVISNTIMDDSYRGTKK